jgi:DNA primase
VQREDFTLRTVPDRLEAIGDLWQALRASRGADLRELANAASPHATDAAPSAKTARAATRRRPR